MRIAALLRLVVLVTGLVIPLSGWSAIDSTGYRDGIVASGNPLATRAGVEVLKRGGNAIDAAVAVALALNVTEPHNSGIGGGCFILIRRANGELAAIDGREMAPAKATRDMYLRNGRGDTALSQTGALASGVPGALAAYSFALTNFGTWPLERVVQPAAQLAAGGFEVTPYLAARFRATEKKLARFPSTKAAIWGNRPKPPIAGARFVQADLAATLRAIGESGPDWFYRGPFAQRTAVWMRDNGGIMTKTDFANYQARLRPPVRGTYRGNEIVSFPPPSSGGVHVVQILNILEHFNLAALASAPARRQHVIAEAMKLAFADRAHWLGDPDFTKVPLGLTDKSYAKQLAARIQPDRVITVPQHGIPPGADAQFFERHTTHFCVADAAGNWVACTATINTTFGSGVIIPGTGVFMNNEMDDFSVQPGMPNAFGLIGSEANAVAPGKRPLSSMSPTIVLKDGKPVIALGAAGGPTIITQTVQNLIAILDFDLSPMEAIARARLHHQWRPDELRVERKMEADVRTALERMGHRLSLTSGIGVSQIIAIGSDGKFTGAADPRAIGTVDGVGR